MEVIMKRVIVICLIGLWLFYPASVFATLILMTETEMRAAFAQAGISIEIEYIEVKESFRELEYKDADGTNGVTAYFKVRERYNEKTYQAVYTEDDFKTLFAEVTGGAESMGAWDKLSYLTIDTGACDVLTAIEANNMGLESSFVEQTSEPVIGVVIGLPTLVIHSIIDDYAIGVDMEGAINDGANYMRITQKDNVMVILGGHIEIAAH
jgi:hypothetical protein